MNLANLDTSKIIIALDTTELDDFYTKFYQTKDLFSWFKIHSIFLKEHTKPIFTLRENGKKIFLDLKFFDIPTTVENHIRSISKFADMFTIHLLSGKECLKRVSKISRELNMIPVGVSILTSFSEEDLKEIGINNTIISEVLKLVELGVNSGIEYFVCSPLEVKIVKNNFPNVKLITPGIRLQKEKDDQKRIMTPEEAFKEGSDFIVMGRDIFRVLSSQQ
jgi:orotidine-5'-phosphate decarboxylase